MQEPLVFWTSVLLFVLLCLSLAPTRGLSRPARRRTTVGRPQPVHREADAQSLPVGDGSAVAYRVRKGHRG
ncbi:MAG: hypothetical protein QN163_01720 [Armatimonadota bacterium]|nr:hypothetical protein [Armatimonadota bacterium]MDR5696384.1 hypothetical protein [Armatimonadota bacterium]